MASDRDPAHTASEHDVMPEGAEAPPPGVRAMAIVRWALVVLMGLAAVGAWVQFAGLTPSARASSAAHYHCPMHPAVLQDRSGQCPICGMDLVPVEGATGGAARTTSPAGPATAGSATAGKYWCPMHPEVASDDPEAHCAKCGGMKLLPREAPAATAAVPDLAPVEIGAARTQLMGVRTARVARERVATRVRTVGFVSADETRLAVVTARFTGWIETLEVARSGERVEKGQILATAYSQEILTAQQVYLTSAKWADGQGQGAAVSPTNRVEIDARKRLELFGVAPADVSEIARRGQPMLNVPLRAPVAGYVARKAALPGVYVQPGTELFQIADLSTVWVLADVHERDLDRVKVGQRARLTLAAHPGETFTGRVQLIYPAVNPESRTVQARMEFRNPGLRLRPGMSGDVVLEAPSNEALAVPVEAVVDTGELQYVFLAHPGGRFEPRGVRLGVRGEGRVEVQEGLAEGDMVVTTANFLIDSESRLRAAVEGFRPGLAAEERREHEPDERRALARSEDRK